MTFNQLTIKQKLIFAIVIAVLASTALVGFISQNQARHVVETRLLESELPATLMQIRNTIDKEVSVLQSAAEQLATNRFIVELYNSDRSPQQETRLIQVLNDIRTQYDLFDASVADRSHPHRAGRPVSHRRIRPEPVRATADRWSGAP